MHRLLGILALCWAGMAWAGPALVLAIRGEVQVEVRSGGGDGAALEQAAFRWLNESDRLVLAEGGGVTLLYPASGREEAWSGPGRLVVGTTESAALGTTPDLQVRHLPAKVARLIARTPVDERAGRPTRTRAFAKPENLAALEAQYQSLRREAPEADRAPEAYWLAGLFELREFERLEAELQAVGERYPEDRSLKVLRRLYVRAINNARQAGR